jgi:glycosyltransferase involved in cell wall biosynthesis
VTPAPLVSIVLPTWNRAALLRPTLDSIRAQTLADWELLVVDDGSTDGTEELVRGYGEPRFAYMKNARGRGVARARNTALERARGEFIAFQDAGETWPADKLSLQVEAMRRLPSQVGLVYGNYMIHEAGGRRKLSRPKAFHAGDEDTARRALALDVSTIDTPTWLLRRSVYAACGGFDEALVRREDTEYLIRAALSGFRFQYLDALTAESYEREQSLSKDPDTLLLAHEYMTRKYADRLTPELLACHHRSLGRILLELTPTRLPAARSFLWKAARPPHGGPADWLWLGLSLGGNPAYRLAIAASALLRRLGVRR